MKNQKAKPQTVLPETLRPIFWEYDFDSLSWHEDTDLIIGRILESGRWEDIRYLRSCIDATTLRQWIIDHRGKGLNPPKIRFWQLILNLPNFDVNAWIKSRENDPWEKRISA